MKCMKPTHIVSSQPAQPVAARGIIAYRTTLSMAQVGQLSGIADADLLALLDYGVLLPLPDVEPAAFPIECVTLLQRADRLRRDLALDEAGFALAVMFVSQIATLEAQLQPGCLLPGQCRSDA